MRFLNFIDNIDWNKNIFYLIIYVSIIVLCAFFYLFPIMDNYKSAVMEYRRTNVLDAQIEGTLASLNTAQEKFLNENVEIFTKLAKAVDEAEIRAFASNYLKEINISDLGVKNGENNLKIHHFKLEGKARNLAQIKDLIANISTLPNTTRIAFPLIIRKKANTFFIDMELWIYGAESSI